MKSKNGDEFSRFFRVLAPILGVSFLGYLLLGHTPPAAPDNAKVFGCYSAPRSPFILLEIAGLHVR
jgi:hypothetical protein